jgi:hypothetical protein
VDSDRRTARHSSLAAYTVAELTHGQTQCCEDMKQTKLRHNHVHWRTFSSTHEGRSESLQWKCFGRFTFSCNKNGAPAPRYFSTQFTLQQKHLSCRAAIFFQSLLIPVRIPCYQPSSNRYVSPVISHHHQSLSPVISHHVTGL